MKLELAVVGITIGLLVHFAPQVAERLRPILPVQTSVPGNCRPPEAGEQLLIAVTFEQGRVTGTSCMYVMSRGAYAAERRR